MKTRFFKIISLMLMVTMLLAPLTVSAAPPVQDEPPPDEKVQSSCALLDDPVKRTLMSGAFETNLLVSCGRADELGQVRSAALASPTAPDDLGLDVLINDPTGEQPTASQFTQSETSLARNEDSSVICSAYNDAYDGLVTGQGFTGYASSTDKGATWTDHGGIGADSSGDPANVWSKRDNTFYHASLHSNGLGLWDFGAGCDSSSFVAMIHTGSGDDKELMAVDNDPSSSYYGRLYVGWTDFNVGGGQIHVTYSDDGTTWSTPVAVSVLNSDAQGAWPAVDPVTGDVYVTWVRWNPYPSGAVDVEIVRSTDGGNTFNFVTNPMTGQVNPRESAATATCGRPALNGAIRYLPSPQIVVDQNGNLHVVYSYDADGFDTGDVIDVYYRRSTDQGATWEPEIQLNDDATLTDQWFPALAVNDNGVVGTFWYDRRDDLANNYQFYYYKAVSYDNGVTFEPNERVSDVASNVILDSNLATCYHGDYDTSIADATRFYIQWSDDRPAGPVSQEDPNVWSDTELIMTEIGVLEGRVTDVTAAPLADLADVDVRATLNATYTFGTSTDANGIYSMMVSSGTYDVMAGKYGYQISTISGVSVVSGTTTTQDIVLALAATYLVDGTVTDSVTGDPLWATIDISGDPFNPPTTTLETDPATGYYSITLSGDITYTFDASALLHVPTTTVLAPLTGDTTLDFDLDAITQTGLIAGWVLNYYTDDPVEGATVDVDGGPSATTDADGYFETATMPAGFYTATASADLYSSVAITDVEVITSNVALLTYRLPTARLEIAPMALEETLMMGGVVTNTGQLVITNTGIGDLDWEIGERGGDYMPASSRAPSDLNGVNILFDESHGGSATSYDDLIADLTTASATVDVITTGPIDTALLSGYDVYWIPDSTNTVWTAAELQDIEDWVNGGGGLFINYDCCSDDTAPAVAALFDITYLGTGGTGGVTSDFFPHPTTDGITAINLPGPYQSLAVAGSAEVVVNDVGEEAQVAVNQVGGRVVVVADDAFNDGSNYASNDNALFAANIFEWLSSGGAGVPWIAEDPISGTLSYSSSQSIDVTWDASVPEVDQPGIYYANFKIENNDPLAQDLQIPVTMTVQPPSGWGLLNGMVTSYGYCDVNPYAIEGAELFLEGSGGYTYTLWTGDDDYGWPDGYYARWLDSAQSPYTVTVTYPEHPTTVITIFVSSGVTTTQDFGLRWQQPCIDVMPGSISETLDMGDSITVPMTIKNFGAVTLDFEWQEKDGGFAPTMARLAGEDVLVVRVDTTAAAAMETALTTLGYTYLGVTAAEFQAMSVDDLLEYQAVFHAGNTADATEVLLILYLDAGGSVYVSDNDLGYWNNGETFYDTYLQATYVSDDPYIDTLIGEGIMAGLSLDISADDYPDDFTVKPDGTRIFQYAGGNAGGVAVDRNGYKAIYTSFDFYEIATLDNEQNVIQRVMGFLAGGDVPWLSEDPISGTVAADGGMVMVDVVLDAGQVTQPGMYYATLNNKSNDPSSPVGTLVTMTVNAPPTWGKLEGTVFSLGHCDVNPVVLEDAVVLIEDGGVVSVTTDAGGFYSLWLDGGTYTVTVSFADHVAGQAVVVISGSGTTVWDFDLRSIEPCVSVAPLSMEATLLSGDSEVQVLNLSNAGAGDTSFEIREQAGNLLNKLLITLPEPQRAASGSDMRQPASESSTARSFYVSAGLLAPHAVNLLILTPDADISDLTAVLTPFADLSVTVFPNASLPTLAVADLLPYDVVMITNNTKWADSGVAASLVGDVLADYVDAGGKVVVNNFVYDNAGWGLEGRFMTEQYGPFTVATADFIGSSSLGTVYEPGHPIMTGVTVVGNSYLWQNQGITAGATRIADWDDGNIFIAVNNNVVALNILPSDGGGVPGWTGDLPTVYHNAVVWLLSSATDVPWLSEDPITGTVKADSSFDVDITFTALPTMTSGVYSATLIVGTADAGGSIKVPVTMTIVGVANCGFSSSSPDNLGETTYFTNTSTGDPPLTSRWNFGDGSAVSAAENPTHDYAQSGSYTVILTVTNQPTGTVEVMSVCTDVVSILGPPTADFESNSPVLLGSPMVFADTSMAYPSVSSWSWAFGDGVGVSTDQNPVYTYTASGDYVVTLTVTNTEGSDLYTDTVTVLDSNTYIYLPLVVRGFEGTIVLPDSHD